MATCIPSKLNCLVQGDNPGRALPIQLNGKETVGDLKLLVKAVHEPRLNEVSAAYLDLWAVTVPTGHPSILSTITDDKKRFLDNGTSDIVSALDGFDINEDLYIIIVLPSSK